MGTTLTGTTPQDTYDSLIKVTDNGPLSGTAKYLSDGLGNDSVLALSTARVGIGTTTPVSALTVVGTTTSGITIQSTVGASNGLKIFNDSTTDTASIFNHYSGSLILGTSNTERVRITSTGNVGIGTSSPLSLLDIENSNGSTFTLGTATAAGSIASKKFTTLNFNGYNNTTTAQIQSWDESASTGFGYLTLSTFTGSVLTEKVRILPTGGITFNGDTAAANALDDYEEGTWTMGITFGGADTGITYANRTGTYTKVGRQVTVNGYIALSSKGSATGVAQITGLPFAQVGTAQNYSAASSYLVNVTFANQFTIIGLSGTALALYQITEAGAASGISNSDFSNASEVLISYTYFTA